MIKNLTVSFMFLCFNLNVFALEEKAHSVFERTLEKGDYYCCLDFECTSIPPEPSAQDNGGVAGDFGTEVDKWRMKGDISHHHADERSTVFIQLFEDKFVQSFHIFMNYGTKISTLVRSPHGNGSARLECKIKS